jgi:hypothetical protein
MPKPFHPAASHPAPSEDPAVEGSFGKLVPADTQWLCAGGFTAETQVYYSMLPDGKFLLCQVIHSSVGYAPPFISDHLQAYTAPESGIPRSSSLASTTTRQPRSRFGTRSTSAIGHVRSQAKTSDPARRKSSPSSIPNHQSPTKNPTKSTRSPTQTSRSSSRSNALLRAGSMDQVRKADTVISVRIRRNQMAMLSIGSGPELRCPVMSYSRARLSQWMAGTG